MGAQVTETVTRCSKEAHDLVRTNAAKWRLHTVTVNGVTRCLRCYCRLSPAPALVEVPQR